MALMQKGVALAAGRMPKMISPGCIPLSIMRWRDRSC